MLKRIRKSGLVKRSFTGDFSVLGRMRSRTSKLKKLGKDATTNTPDSSSDEGENNPQTIRWERTPSGKMHPEERKIRMKELPDTSCFSSNHILVNKERIRHGRDPLVRCRHLDAIAKKHAQQMADAQELLEHPICSATMAENVQRGPSIRLIHQFIMMGVSDEERDNVLSERFSRFGMGTAPGDDGMIYMSQIFQASAAKRRPTL